MSSRGLARAFKALPIYREIHICICIYIYRLIIDIGASIYADAFSHIAAKLPAYRLEGSISNLMKASSQLVCCKPVHSASLNLVSP